MPIIIYIYWLYSCLLLSFSMRKKQGFLHFPFFVNIAVVVFIGPQLIQFSLLETWYNFELNVFITIVLASVSAIYIGFYAVGGGVRILQLPVRLLYSIKEKNVLGFLLLVLFVSWFSFAMLILLSGGWNNFLYRSSETIVWTGLAVWLTFFVQFVYFVFPTSLFVAYHSGEKSLKIISLLSVLVPMIYIFFLNRRFVFFNIGITVFYYLTVYKKVKFRSIYLIIIIFTAMFVLNMFPMMRSGDNSLLEIVLDLKAESDSVLVSDNYGEVKNGVLAISSILDSNQYEYGFGIVKQIFKDYIPGAIIGKSLKNEILGSDGIRRIVETRYAYSIPGNEFVTGFAWLFYQFGLLTLAFWILIGYSFKVIWNGIRDKSILKSSIFYVCALPIGLTSIVYSAGVAVSLLIKLVIFVKMLFFANRLNFKKHEIHRTS